MNLGRQELYNQKYGLAYGVDHALGKFIQVWKLNAKYPPRAPQNLPDESNILVDKDEFSNSLSISEVVSIAAEFGFGLSFEIEEQEVNYEE